MLPGSVWRYLLSLLVMLASVACTGSDLRTAQADTGGDGRLLADIEVHTPEAVVELLARLDLLADANGGFPSHEPVVMVLHGDEAAAFTRANYATYRVAVDRAALLEAFGLLDVRICERWMLAHGLVRGDLPSFVDTVPDGMIEERRLERAGYLRF